MTLTVGPAGLICFAPLVAGPAASPRSSYRVSALAVTRRYWRLWSLPGWSFRRLLSATFHRDFGG
ncbi:hypothetical protein AB0M34_10545 [Nocardia sp. NPDC050193]